MSPKPTRFASPIFLRRTSTPTSFPAARELAARTGAPIYVGASDAYGFDHHALRDGDTVKVGPFTLRVLHTPGHSPEHICLVVSGGGKGAEHDWAVFTGDTLFAGEVGRPDLAENVKDEAKRGDG